MSAIPFVALYPLRKLKKIRRMFVYGIIMTVISYLAAIILVVSGHTISESVNLSQYGSIPFTIGFQMFCVYHWTRKYNQSLTTHNP